ncbi:hypothetical protein ACVIW0_005551 [Bradyrhizobium sp. USDA 4454]
MKSCRSPIESDRVPLLQPQFGGLCRDEDLRLISAITHDGHQSPISTGGDDFDVADMLSARETAQLAQSDEFEIFGACHCDGHGSAPGLSSQHELGQLRAVPKAMGQRERGNCHMRALLCETAKRLPDHAKDGAAAWSVEVRWSCWLSGRNSRCRPRLCTGEALDGDLEASPCGMGARPWRSRADAIPSFLRRAVKNSKD